MSIPLINPMSESAQSCLQRGMKSALEQRASDVDTCAPCLCGTATGDAFMKPGPQARFLHVLRRPRAAVEGGTMLQYDII